MAQPLLMTIPQLLGARNAIQYINQQPDLPQAAMPHANQVQKNGTSASSIMNQVASSAAQAARQAQEQQDQANSTMSSGLGSLGGAMGSTMNPTYWLRKMGIGYSGTGPLPTPFQTTPNVPALDMSQFQMPKIF